MHYGMDLFEELVLAQVERHRGSARAAARDDGAQHRSSSPQDSSKEVTIILHEHQTLTGAAQREINARKKRYVRFLEDVVPRGDRARADPRRSIRRSPRSASSAVVLWTYKWYRPTARLSPQQLTDGMIDLFFEGLLPR